MNISRPLARYLFALPWIAMVLMFGFLLSQRFPLSGIFESSFVFDGSSPWLDPFLPAERVTPIGLQPEGWTGQRIFQDPVYQSAREPGVFDRLRVIWEARPTQQPLLEAGILRDAGAFSFEMVPLWSEVLDRGWRMVQGHGLRGLVREDLPDEALWSTPFDELLVWRAPVSSPALQDGAGTERTVQTSFVGSHDFFVVPAAQELSFHFFLEDANVARTGAVATFRVQKEQETLFTDALMSSSLLEHDSQKKGEEIIHLSHLTPGVYRVSVIADEQVTIREIKTTAQHWVVGPTIRFGSLSGSSGILVWTNSQHVLTQTFHPGSQRTIFLGASSVSLQNTNQFYALNQMPSKRGTLQALKASQGEIQIIGDGFFALLPEAFFAPSPRRFTDASRPGEEGIKAVLTSYAPPEKLSDGWLKLSASFDLPTAQDRPKLIWSAPGIVIRGGSVDIRHASIRFERPALSWGTIWIVLRRELSAAWHRIAL